jgi:sugar lactone lactonase YvrE
LAVSHHPAFGAPGQAWVALEQPRGTGSVSFVDPRSGAIAPFAADFQRPTALAFSPDGAVLWVADAGTGRLWRIWRH